MDVILFGLSVIFALFFGLFFNAIVRHSNRVAFLLGWFVIIFAGIILTAEICSLFSSLSQVGFLVVQLSLAIIGWGLWRMSGSPTLVGPLQRPLRLPLFHSHKILYVFSIACLVAYLVNAYVILSVPQNNYDSMTYHLARVGYWMQNETLYPWETPNPRQTSFPPNAEIGLLWSMLYFRSDILTGFVQWFFTAAGFLAIYGMSMLLGALRKQALFAGLVWLTLPQIVLQSTTTQNDLVVSSLFLIAMYFLYQGWLSLRPGILFISGTALGLALGTKLTAGMAVPGLGIMCLILWIKSRQRNRFLYTLTASYLLGLLLFASLGYIQNLVYYGTILGPKDYIGFPLDLLHPMLRVRLQNFLVYSYQFLDFSGLPPALAGELVELKAKLVAPIFEILGSRFNYANASVSQILHYAPRLHEDFSWFGPLSIVGIIPGVVIGARKSVHRENGLLTWGIILVAVLFSGLIIYQGWSPHRSRYLVLAVTLLAPLLFYLYNDHKPAYAFILMSIGGLVLWHTVLRNEAKPLIGPGAIWGKDSLAIRTINYPTIEPLVRAAEKYIPNEARLAVKLGSNGWDYVFFGEGLNHMLVQVWQDPNSAYGQKIAASGFVSDPEDLGTETILRFLADSNIEYMIIGQQEEFFLRYPAGLEPIVELESGGIYRIIPQDIGKHVGDQVASLPELDDSGILKVEANLTQTVGVMEVWVGSWAIEQYQGDSFLWLGQGEAQGLGAKLWADKNQNSCVNLTLLPGPGREDAQRTLSFVYFDENNLRVTATASFDKPVELSFELPIHQGVNSFGFSILEPATILVQPNGDSRQLLARLEQMTVTDSTGVCQ